MTKTVIDWKTILWLTIPQMVSLISTIVIVVIAFMNVTNRLSFIEKTYVSEASLIKVLDKQFDEFESSLEETIIKEIQYAISQEDKK